MEINYYIKEKDISEVIVCGRDQTGLQLENWRECPDYAMIVEEGIVFDCSTTKAINENLPQLYKEIKLRVV